MWPWKPIRPNLAFGEKEKKAGLAVNNMLLELCLLKAHVLLISDQSRGYFSTVALVLLLNVCHCTVPEIKCRTVLLIPLFV